jgi:pyruvate formate lyase activating enzyme
MREVAEVVSMIESARLLISGVVFSGGEPTAQEEALVQLAEAAKGMGLATGIQTNGYFPETLSHLIDRRLVNRIALDFKTRWEGYTRRLEGYGAVARDTYHMRVRQAIRICQDAVTDGRLPEFEIVATIFPGNEYELAEIGSYAAGTDLVLQQGEYKPCWGDWIREEKGSGKVQEGTRAAVPGHIRPLSVSELRTLADRLGRKVRIRTREGGEEVYEGHRRRRAACKR